MALILGTEKPNVMLHTRNPSTLDIDSEENTHDHLQLSRKFKVSLGYMRSYSHSPKPSPNKYLLRLFISLVLNKGKLGPVCR